MRCLEPQVDNRWASAAALGDALQDAMLRNPAWRSAGNDGARLIAQQIRQRQFVGAIDDLVQKFAQVLACQLADQALNGVGLNPRVAIEIALPQDAHDIVEAFCTGA